MWIIKLFIITKDKAFQIKKNKFRIFFGVATEREL